MDNLMQKIIDLAESASSKLRDRCANSESEQRLVSVKLQTALVDLVRRAAELAPALLPQPDYTNQTMIFTRYEILPGLALPQFFTSKQAPTEVLLQEALRDVKIIWPDVKPYVTVKFLQTAYVCFRFAKRQMDYDDLYIFIQLFDQCASQIMQAANDNTSAQVFVQLTRMTEQLGGMDPTLPQPVGAPTTSLMLVHMKAIEDYNGQMTRLTKIRRMAFEAHLGQQDTAATLQGLRAGGHGCADEAYRKALAEYLHYNEVRAMVKQMSDDIDMMEEVVVKTREGVKEFEAQM